jgi:hypothetical protein
MDYTSKKILLGCCVLLLSCLQVLAQDRSSGDIENEKGRNEAARDLKQGVFVIKSSGQARLRIGGVPSLDDVYESMLWEKYKIRRETVGSCFLNDDTLRYVAGYNEVSIPAIEEKYGKEIFIKVRKEAETEYELKYAKENREFTRRMIETLKTLPKRENRAALRSIRADFLANEK